MALVTGLVTVIGHTLVAVGVQFSSYPLLLTARMIYGFGYSSYLSALLASCGPLMRILIFRYFVSCCVAFCYGLVLRCFYAAYVWPLPDLASCGMNTRVPCYLVFEV